MSGAIASAAAAAAAPGPGDMNSGGAGGGASDSHFSLVWNTFPRNLSSGLYSLLTCEQLVDVTLAADGHILRAHKLVLSVCSSYFRELFKGNTCKHPIVILKDVSYRDLSAMLHFMYQGEVNIKQEDIASFLKVAEALKIKGLTRTSDDDDEMDKDMTYGMPFPCHEQQQQQAKPTTGSQPFNEPLRSTTWTGYPHSSPSKLQVNDVKIKRPRLPSESSVAEDSTVPEDKPLDCSAAPEDCKTKTTEYPEYKPNVQLVGDGVEHSAPQSESILRPCEQENSLAVSALSYAGFQHCRQSDSTVTGFHDTGTTMKESFDLTNSSSATSNATSKGRRTVKGLQSSSLSLETTLRVISELGPTIRVERGKVIRMYSCPWCLRHFTRKENLKLHVRYIHGPLESLTCKLCGNKYKNSNSLRVHSYLYHNAQRNKSGSSSSGGSGKPPIVGGNV